MVWCSMLGLSNSDRLIYDENVLEYLYNYEEVRNVLPKIICAIFDKLGDVKLKLALNDENELEICIRFSAYDENTLVKIGEAIEHCADDLLEIAKNNEGLWVHISTDFADYDYREPAEGKDRLVI